MKKRKQKERKIVKEEYMENTISVFKNEKFGEVRTIAMNNDIYFVGKDVAEALGYTDTIHAVLDHVDKDDRVNSKTQGQNAPEFGQRGTWLINESGVYSLIFGSKLESAKEFKHWVTSEVLPSIRKNGMYAMDELLENPDLLVETAIKLRDEKRRRLEAEKKSQKLEIKLDESKEWYSVKRMEKLNPNQKFNWRLLKKESEKLGKEIKKCFDANYGEVNVYHVSVWESLFFDTLNF